MRILITGCAGFIGMHTALKLLLEQHQVVGIDNLNEYYSIPLKMARLALLDAHANFTFHKLNLDDKSITSEVFAAIRPELVIHLAAQAGVRYSLQAPHAYINSNILGFINLLECCRQYPVQHLVYASSSSVYGLNQSLPFAEAHTADHPISLYAATKKSNELMAHTYSHLFQIPTTGLRFFTVYGPWGRPDMALFRFMRSILNNLPIDVYNHGKMARDFTYIDDIVYGIIKVLDKPASAHLAFDPYRPNPAISSAPYRIFNIGNGQPQSILNYINTLEVILGTTVQKNYMDLQPGDLEATWADTVALYNWIKFKPKTSIAQGVAKFVQWYQSHATLLSEI